MKSAILFDLDGTLVSTKRLYLESYRRALRVHAGRVLSDDELLAMRPRSELHMLRSLIPDTDAYDRCCQIFYAEYAALHDTHFEGVYDGVPEMLDALRRRGIVLGIVTGKSRRAWEITSALAPLGSFDVIVLDDEVSHPKPDPHGLLIALARLGTTPDRVAYVGDTRSDMEAAVAARVLPVWAAWSRRPDARAAVSAQVRALGGRIADTPADVARLIPRV